MASNSNNLYTETSTSGASTLSDFKKKAAFVDKNMEWLSQHAKDGLNHKPIDSELVTSTKHLEDCLTSLLPLEAALKKKERILSASLEKSRAEIVEAEEMYFSTSYALMELVPQEKATVVAERTEEPKYVLSTHVESPDQIPDLKKILANVASIKKGFKELFPSEP